MTIQPSHLFIFNFKRKRCFLVYIAFYVVVKIWALLQLSFVVQCRSEVQWFPEQWGWGRGLCLPRELLLVLFLIYMLWFSFSFSLPFGLLLVWFVIGTSLYWEGISQVISRLLLSSNIVTTVATDAKLCSMNALICPILTNGCYLRSESPANLEWGWNPKLEMRKREKPAEWN